jgi:hypothetical protein
VNDRSIWLTKIRSRLSLAFYALGCVLVEGAIVVAMSYLGGSLLFYWVYGH